MKYEALTDKIIVLGIDGFDPKHAKYLLDQGKMPALKEFVDRGAAREDLVMLGGMPTVTPPMWTTLATGAPACVHGITGFFNQHPTKLDYQIYALDSRMCRAEQLWNVFAEAGKNTLVWHWPGSSWPPTSDSPNLSVVDGTQPGNIDGGTGLADWEITALADESIDAVRFAGHDTSDRGVNGCVITGLEEQIKEEEKDLEDLINENPSGATAIAIIVGKAKECHVYVMDESETEINLLTGSNTDTVNSPISLADDKWAHAPEGAKEFTLITSGGFIRRPCR